MSESESVLSKKDLLKPIELSSGALVLFGFVVVGWLPTSPDDRRTVTLFLLAFALYILVYFHWLWPRHKDLVWMNQVPAVANISVLTAINYIVGAVLNVEVIYIIIVVNAAIRLGRRSAMVVAAFSALMIVGTNLIRGTTSPGVSWISSGLSILVFLIAGYLAGALADTIRRQARQAQTLQRAVQRQAERISVVNEVDHFKTYNDTYGHVMGDQVLRLTVQAIQAHVKQTDAVGRWGGEEFGVVLPNSTTEQTCAVAERIRTTLADLPLVDAAGRPVPKPTVSQGIATFPDHVADGIHLVDVADAVLYQAKERGRDQVCVANSTMR